MFTRWLGLLLFVVWIGSSGTAHGAPEITVSPSPPIDIGSVRANIATVATTTRVVTITNSGTGMGSPNDLRVTSITFDSSEFTLSGTAPSPASPFVIPVGMTRDVTVALNPTAIGTRTAIMTILSNAQTSPTTTVDLTGTGTTAIISVPAIVDFSIVPNGVPATQQVAITNTAATFRGPLTVTAASITGSTFYSFGTLAGCSGTSCTFNPPLVITSNSSNVPVICQPPAAASGTSNATLTFTSDTEAGGNAIVSLACTAGRSDIQVSTTPLTFDNIAVGQTAAQSVTIGNGGNQNLTYSIAMDPVVSQFAFTAGCTANCTLPPGSPPVSFALTFTPDSPAPVTTEIVITHNDPDPDENPKRIDVTGTASQGVIATIPASPTPLAFGDVAQGSTKTLTFTLRNSGNVAITGIMGTLINGNLGFQFNPASVPATLNPSQQVTLSVTFAPPVGTVGGQTTINFQGSWTAHGRTATTTAVLNLSGTGLSTGYDVTPAVRDFGGFRFDKTPQLTFQITNTAQAPMVVESMLFTPGPQTTAGEFAFEIRRPNDPTVLALPQPLLAGQRFDVTVIAQPNSRIGMVSGEVNVHTSLSPDRTVTLMGNAISAAITAPALLDFGAIDIDGLAPSKTITLTNNGAAPLDIMSISTVNGGSDAFEVTPLPTTMTTVGPGADFTLNVKYTPMMTRPSNQPEVLVLDAALGGIFGGPSRAMITIQGRGIDRVLAIDEVTESPRAFRNPGDAAPEVPITVRNAGEAPLNITAVMLTDDPATAGRQVWQLVDAMPVSIGPLGQHTFRVKFAPTEVDDKLPEKNTPDGKLLLMNDDNARSMAIATLKGTCVPRNVVFGPAPNIETIDLGPIAVGVATEADFLPVVNMDPSVAFTIREIELVGDSAFQLDSVASDVALPASTTKRFLMTLEPDARGRVTTRARLYLDQDPIPHKEITITAEAVAVSARGGGGCSAGRAGTGGGSALALAIFAAFGVVGRRRRRIGRWFAAAAMVALVALAPAARADESIDLMVFGPTPATTGAGLQLQSPEVGAHGSWVASSVMSYASNPLALSGGGIEQAVVERSALLQLGFAYALLGRLELGGHMPLYMQDGQGTNTGQAMGVNARPADGMARGKLTLHAKARLWRGSVGPGALAVGASAAVLLPTATAGEFSGSKDPGARLLLLGSFSPTALGSRLSIAANAGAIVRGKARYADISQGNGVAWGLGTSYRLLDNLWAMAEVFGEVTPSGLESSRSGSSNEAMATSMLSQVEWLAGMSFQADRRFTVGLAAGRGLNSGLGTPELRGVVSLAFVPGAPAVAPIQRVESPRLDVDSDGDGIADGLDKCASEAEDKDLFDDEDGCPDADNDRDGLADASDRCPLDAEDKDGFQDDDGCLDKDNDGDGIVDTQDRCPLDAEDKDGFEDVDGCADVDNDRDGIRDAQDKCPIEPETINGQKDDDGCPDKGDSTIVLSPDRIETLDPIVFTGVKLGRQSLPLLGQVAATLRAHREIVRVRVTVHVQPTGDIDADQAKSEKRAQAVRDWLVQWGIEPARVEVRGFGGSKPLVPADQRGAARLNDRLEFIILERK